MTEDLFSKFTFVADINIRIRIRKTATLPPLRSLGEGISNNIDTFLNAKNLI